MPSFLLKLFHTLDIICLGGSAMAFNQKEYIRDYNLKNYKMFQFRVKKSDTQVLAKLGEVENRNSYLLDLIAEDLRPRVLTIKQIKAAVLPIMLCHHIRNVYLFGSYARGEATPDSDVDIYCDRGDIETLSDMVGLRDDLEDALLRKVDIILTDSKIDPLFYKEMKKDLIKLCY